MVTKLVFILTNCAKWLRHYVTNWKVAGSRSDEMNF
jgi:hypothetical protein